MMTIFSSSYIAESKPLKMSSDTLPITGETDDFNYGGGFEFSEQSVRMGEFTHFV